MAKGNMWIWIVGILIALVALGYINLGSLGQQPTVPPVTGGCELAPSIVNTTVDKILTSTAITPGIVGIRVNGVYRGTTLSSTFSKGDTGEIIYGGNAYQNVKESFGPLDCGVNNIDASLYKTSNASFKVFNDVGQVVTDAVIGGATNQSASATTIDAEFKIVGPADKSSGDMICVFEATVTAEVDDIVLSGATEVGIPQFYTVAGANSVSFAYEVPALIDGASKTYNLKIVPETSATIDDVGVYTTCYSKQWFVDTDGTFKYGIEDSDGTAKYDTTINGGEATGTYDYDIFIT